MAHPFTKIFDAALRRSTAEENFVVAEALKLKERGYSVSEIYGVLLKMHQGLIADDESEIVGEALEAFKEYIDED